MIKLLGLDRASIVILCLFGLVALAEIGALAADPPLLVLSPRELKRMSIEELMDQEVTSVTRTTQPFSTSASAIYVLNSDDIARSGALTIPDALRLVPGLQVARYGGRSHAISARGFNAIAGNKLQVMMDGRSLYTPLLSGVFWDVQDTLFADIERIEVVRGPGATMWGANAVNGVINITTRSAEATQGTLLVSGGGLEERALGAIRYGGKLGSRTFYRVYVKYFETDEMELTNGMGAEDETRQGQGGFRIDSDLNDDNRLTLQGDLYYNRFGIRGRPDADAAGGNLLGRWTHSYFEGSDSQLQFYYDRTFRSVPLQFEEYRDTYDLDWQHRIPVGDRHEIVWGLNGRVSSDDTGTAGTVQFEPQERTIYLADFFVQDEIALIDDRLSMVVGSKFGHNSFTGFEVQPSARLAWTPSPEQTIWAAASRAVRTPTRIEDDLVFIPNPATGTVLIRGNRDFESEDLLAFELGHRMKLNHNVSLDLAGFYNIYDNLRTQEPTPGTVLPLRVANEREGDTYGAEVALRVQPADVLQFTIGYSYLEEDLRLKPGSGDVTGGTAEGNDPRHTAFLHSSFDILSNLELNAVVRYVDALPNPAVPSYTELDLRLAWRPTDAVEISVVGRNLLDEAHPEFGAQGPGAPQVERSVFAKLTWQF